MILTGIQKLDLVVISDEKIKKKKKNKKNRSRKNRKKS
jgi:hypothetical protein